MLTHKESHDVVIEYIRNFFTEDRPEKESGVAPAAGSRASIATPNPQHVFYCGRDGGAIWQGVGHRHQACPAPREIRQGDIWQSVDCMESSHGILRIESNGVAPPVGDDATRLRSVLAHNYAALRGRLSPVTAVGGLRDQSAMSRSPSSRASAPGADPGSRAAARQARRDSASFGPLSRSPTIAPIAFWNAYAVSPSAAETSDTTDSGLGPGPCTRARDVGADGIHARSPPDRPSWTPARSHRQGTKSRNVTELDHRG